MRAARAEVVFVEVPPNTTYGAKIALPKPANSAAPEYALFIEYRNDVRIGPNLANRPGVFATFYNGLHSLLQLELDAANAGGDAPVRVGTTYKLADTYTLLVNTVGVDDSEFFGSSSCALASPAAGASVSCAA